MVHSDAERCKKLQIGAFCFRGRQFLHQRQHTLARKIACFITRPITALYSNLVPTAPQVRRQHGTVQVVLRKPPNASSHEVEVVALPRPDLAVQRRDMGSSARPVVVLPARYVLMVLANSLTGYSVKAMERKIERGDWPEGKLWRRAPDGRIMIDMVGYQKWVEGT